MVPINLKLSNFTSYGENPPELDFTKFRMGAISGFNGAGKSSLLDAITWCIWGSSRAGDSADALIRLGQNEMQVDFSFELDSHNYTIKRKRSKKSGGHTGLEFWSGSHNLTEGTIKATQQKIINTLHLTFETFTNSSFLRQGHADEFTTKGPSDRKRILADILGLDHYERLEEKAKEKGKESQTKLQLLEYQLIEIEAELSQKEEREKNYSLIEKEAEETKTKVREIEDLIKTIDEEKQTIQVTVNTLKEEQLRFEKINQELEELEGQIELKKKGLLEYQMILDKKELIEKKYAELQSLKGKKKELDTKRSELIKLKDELVETEKKINEREEKRNKAISDVEIQIREYETRNESLLEQTKKLKSDKSLCPTCNQPLGEEKNKEIISKNETQIKENEEKLKELNKKIETFKNIVLPEYSQAKEKEIVIKKLEEETKDYSKTSGEILELERFEQGYLKLQQAEVAVKTQTEALTDLQKIHKNKKEEVAKASNSEAQLDKYETKLREIALRLSTQESIKKELNQKVLDLTGKMGQARQLIDRATQMEKLLKEKAGEKSKLIKEKEVYEELALAFGKKGIQAMIIESAIPEIEDETNRLLERLTDGRMKVRLDTQKETKTKVATGDGKKDYATVETLDIVLSDEMGERPYEMYSGGETFRVNIAIRLAISKLLASRAGARLQFLVIDEGFGTQDIIGRTKLVEVLDTIKNDYEKILIITHLDELKEEFPTRIEVSKASSGSTFEVIGV